ncbi:hypothetical protein AOLI_G00164630 [Acnodon oligacanthus]
MSGRHMLPIPLCSRMGSTALNDQHGTEEALVNIYTAFKSVSGVKQEQHSSRRPPLLRIHCDWSDAFFIENRLYHLAYEED